MRNTLTVLVATFGVLGASMGMAQDKMSGGKMQGHMMSGGKMQSHMATMPTSTMMMGLSADEKKTAMAMMGKMTPAEKAVMAKKCSMCMMDKHTGMVEKMSKMDKMGQQKMEMDHMMSGLSKMEQGTMMKMDAKMSAKEKAVALKMMQNCCMHGMKMK